jgi:hypothetical protein
MPARPEHSSAERPRPSRYPMSVRRGWVGVEVSGLGRRPGR